jgi:putative NADPH-quinone reductase
MSRHILVVVGHPDPDPNRFCRALANAYVDGAVAAGHSVNRIDVATLDFPFLRSADDYQNGSMPPALKDAAQMLLDAQHIAFFFPLWLGTMPAMLKAFLEQVARPGVAFTYPEKNSGGFPKNLLKGRSARLVVTMGMPAFFYRLWFLAHGVAGLRRSILNFVGINQCARPSTAWWRVSAMRSARDGSTTCAGWAPPGDRFPAAGRPHQAAISAAQALRATGQAGRRLPRWRSPRPRSRPARGPIRP